MCRFINNAGSKQGSSSSPVMINAGTWIDFICSTKSQSEGRIFCTPSKVLADPTGSCSAIWAANSAQPRGSLFWNCTRVGPMVYLRAASMGPAW